MTKKAKLSEVRNCRYAKCGIEFTATRKNQFYHAAKCKQADWHEKKFQTATNLIDPDNIKWPEPDDTPIEYGAGYNDCLEECKKAVEAAKTT